MRPNHYFKTPSKMCLPSSEPKDCSTARSGWGINPSTFFLSFRMPAILSSDPFGLDSKLTFPLLLHYLNAIWSWSLIFFIVSLEAK